MAIHARAHHAGDDIAADIAGNLGVEERHDMLAERQPQFHRADRGIEGGGRHIRGAPDVARVDAAEKLRHGGVAGQGDLGDVVAVDGRFTDDPVDNLVGGFQHGRLELFHAVFFRKNDPADDVLAVADLAVEVAVLGQDLPGVEVQQLTEDGGGADIDGHGIRTVGGVTRLDVDDPVFTVRPHRPGDGRGDPKAVGAQDIGDLAQHRQVHLQAVIAEVGVQKTDQAAGVGQVVLGGGFRQGQVALFNGRHEKPLLLEVVEVHLADARGAPLAEGFVQHAGVNGRFGRNTHDDIAENPGLAGQAHAGGDVRLTELFADAPRDLAVFDDDAAFSADPLTAAGGVDVHPGRHRGPDQRLVRIQGNLIIVGQKGDCETAHLRSNLVWEKGSAGRLPAAPGFARETARLRIQASALPALTGVSNLQLRTSMSPSKIVLILYGR